MITLYLDTSMDYLYTAIVKDNKILTETKKLLAKDLSKDALKEVVDMFNKVALTPKDINKIIVVNGPGSFTGIRIGITIAKTFAWALNIDIIPIKGLKAMAISGEDNQKNMPIIDARRGFVYGALYDENNNPIIEDQYLPLSELLEKAKKYDNITVVTNNDINTNYKKLAYDPDILKIVTYFQNEESISPHLVNPLYLKKTEAEEKKGL